MVIIMDNDHITPDRNHSAMLIIDVQRDFTLKGATAEISGTLQSVQYIKRESTMVMKVTANETILSQTGITTERS